MFKQKIIYLLTVIFALTCCRVSFAYDNLFSARGKAVESPLGQVFIMEKSAGGFSTNKRAEMIAKRLNLIIKTQRLKSIEENLNVALKNKEVAICYKNTILITIDARLSEKYIKENIPVLEKKFRLASWWKCVLLNNIYLKLNMPDTTRFLAQETEEGQVFVSIHNKLRKKYLGVITSTQLSSFMNLVAVSDNSPDQITQRERLMLYKAVRGVPVNFKYNKYLNFDPDKYLKNNIKK